MTVKLGSIVLYLLDENDAEHINAWRSNFLRHNSMYASHKHPHEPGKPGATGHVAHTGPSVQAGDKLPAMVNHINEDGKLSLKVMLVGSDMHQVDGVSAGDCPGTWSEMEG